MVNTRVKDIAATATAPALDDWQLLDGATEGTRKRRAPRTCITFRDHGAAADGADNGTGGATGTDDTAAITAAIAEAAALGVPVNGEGRTYRVNSTIELPDSGSTWIENATFVAGGFVGTAIAASSIGTMQRFGFKNFRYIDPRLGAALSQWVGVWCSMRHPTSGHFPPVNFFMEDCYIEAGGSKGIWYRIPSAEEVSNRSVILKNVEFKGLPRTDQDQIAIDIEANEAIGTRLVYEADNVRISHYRKGKQLRSIKSLRINGGRVADCHDDYIKIFGKNLSSVDPQELSSTIITGITVDASAGLYAATETGTQRLLTLGLYTGPLTITGSHFFGNPEYTSGGIVPDAVRGTDSTDEGERVMNSRDVIVGNTINGCARGLDQNNHRNWVYNNNNISQCGVGIDLQHTSLDANRPGQTAHNTLTDCGVGIRYHTLFVSAGGARYRRSYDDNLVQDNRYNNCGIEVQSVPRPDFGGDGPGAEGLVASHKAQRRITAATWIHHHGVPHIIVASATAGMVVRLPFARRQRVGQRMAFFNESTETYGLKPARLLFDDAHVNLTDNLIALPADTLLYTGAQRDFATGDRVILATAGTLPAPLVQGRVYYIVHNPLNRTLSSGASTGQEEIAFAATYEDAVAATPVLIDITSVTGSQTGHMVGDGYWDDTGALQTAESDSDVIETTERLVELVSVPGGWLRTR